MRHGAGWVELHRGLEGSGGRAMVVAVKEGKALVEVALRFLGLSRHRHAVIAEPLIKGLAGRVRSSKSQRDGDSDAAECALHGIGVKQVGGTESD